MKNFNLTGLTAFVLIFLISTNVFGQKKTDEVSLLSPESQKKIMVKSCIEAGKQQFTGELEKFAMYIDIEAYCTCSINKITAKYAPLEFAKDAEGILKKPDSQQIVLDCLMENTDMSNLIQTSSNKIDTVQKTNRKWGELEKQSFISSCTSAAQKQGEYINSMMDVDQYCSCALEKIEARYAPTELFSIYEDLSTNAEFTSIIESCLEQSIKMQTNSIDKENKVFEEEVRKWTKKEEKKFAEFNKQNIKQSVDYETYMDIDLQGYCKCMNTHIEPFYIQKTAQQALESRGLTLNSELGKIKISCIAKNMRK